MFLSQLSLAREIDLISRIVVTVAGKPADDHDIRQFQSVTILRYGLEADLTGCAFEKCTHRRSIHAISSLDLRKYAEDFKCMKMHYLRHVQLDPGKDSWPRFKREVAGKLHYKWLLNTLANLFGKVSECVQWLSFDERLLLTTTASDLDDEIQAYLDFETELKGLVYPSSVTEALNSIIAFWLRNYAPACGPVQCKFGPGAVSEWSGRLPELRKATDMVYDPIIADEFARVFGVDTDQFLPGSPGPASFTNRIIFRPKNALKHRIISAEPCWLTWLQQGLKNPIYAYVNSCPSMNTNFSDQAASRRMALEGSRYGEYATIDFSNASDSITVALVVALFRGTDLLWPLLASRSKVAILPDGRSVTLEKFAPMGSATCFFTMDIVFLSICELAIRQTFGRRGNRDDYVVFGDDVIIRSEAYPAFVAITGSLHLQANEEKSFFLTTTPHYYRESCGIEAYDGVDITPFRYSRFQEPIIERRNPSSLEYVSSNVDNLNRLLRDYALLETRSALWALVKYSTDRAGKHARDVWDHVKRTDVSSADDADIAPIALLVPDGTATNYRTQRRWNAELQRTEVLCSHWRRAKRPRPKDMSVLLWLWCSHAESLMTVDEIYGHAGDKTRYLRRAPGVVTPSRGSVVATATGLRDPQWCLGWFPE